MEGQSSSPSQPPVFDSSAAAVPRGSFQNYERHMQSPSPDVSNMMLPSINFPQGNSHFVHQEGGGVFGSFQHLLSAASSGALPVRNDISFAYGVNQNMFSGGPTQCCVVRNEESPEAVVCDDGYYAGTESEDDDNDGTPEKDDYVASFIDPIGTEEFMQGRDFDYGDFAVGIDDTELAELDVGNNPGLSIEEMNKVYLECNADSVERNSENAEEVCPDLLGGCGCAQQPISHEISPRYLEDVRAGFKKRQRIGTVGQISDCSKSRSMAPFDIAIETAEYRESTEVFEPKLGMVFDSYEEAYHFYNLYSWEHGFGIIFNRHSHRINDKSYRTMQEFTCQKGGSDCRVSTGTKKQKCPARLKLLRDGDRWYVRDFVREHNHPLSVSCAEMREWKSHKKLQPYTLEVIKQLHKNNVPQTTMRSVVGAMHGSLVGSGITKRGMRTVCHGLNKKKFDDDMSKTLLLFKKMKDNDPGFQWSADVGPDGTIRTIMWCSGKSVHQYACFGDAITFDTTYCTNIYKMPFGLFVGVNNHFQTTVFAGVLMKHETAESFKWVFKEFLELMGGPAPQTILTDQCKAMAIALSEVWPDSFHLWCKWHVFKNIRENLGPTYTKNKNFRDELYSIANEMLTKYEFEHAWEDMCARYKLTENQFMIRTFQCRYKWAKPWAKGNFCAGMTSTQRSESANMMLKKFVPRYSSLNQFVEQYDMLLQDRDMEEGRQEDQTKQLVMKHSRMWPIECHAKEIYTKAIFLLFRKQVDRASRFVVTGKGRGFYVVSYHKPSQKQTWYKKEYRVYVIESGARYFCECGYFEHIGLLCCHTLRVLIRLDIQNIPHAHILSRWTRGAKDVLPEPVRLLHNKKTTLEPLSIWQTQMNAAALEVVTKGNADMETISIVLKHMKAASKELDDVLRARTDPASLPVDICTDVEQDQGNKYGASGSSALLSDSEILKMKAPLVEKRRGCPRFKRYRTAADIASKKVAKRGNVFSIDEEESNAVIAKTPSQNKSRSKRKASDPISSEQNFGLPYQTKFCTLCHKPGHNRNKCVLKGDVSVKKARNVVKVRCSKCGMKGHNDEECLVADLENDCFFK